jgi:hypothetical protein
MDGLEQDAPATRKSRLREAATPYRQERQDFKKQEARGRSGFFFGLQSTICDLLSFMIRVYLRPFAV